MKSFLFCVLCMVLTTGCDAARDGALNLRLALWGDVRPSCSKGTYDPATQQMFKGLGYYDSQHRVDLVIGGGDYVCAWPWEGALALAQLETLLGWYPEQLWPRSVWTLGNHEVGHHQLLRSATPGALRRGWLDLHDLRVVWLPSDADVDADLDHAWLERALTHDGRLVVVRHEPWGSCGTRGDDWIRDRVRGARPNLVVFGHVHTWAGPSATITECGRSLTLAANEVIVGNGGAPGWRQSAGWAGFTEALLAPAGSVRLTGFRWDGEIRGTIAATAEVAATRR